MTGRTRKRDRHDIMVEILKSARGGTKKTRVMYKARLSFFQLEQYLHALNDSGFITEENGVWKTTEKGLHVIAACELCLRLTEEV